MKPSLLRAIAFLLALPILHARAQVGTVKSFVKISSLHGGLPAILQNGDQFGRVAAFGDFNHDGTQDLISGIPGNGGYIITELNPDGTVLQALRYDLTDSLLSASFSSTDELGSDVAAVGDIDGNGVTDICLGAPGADSARGEVALVLLNSSGAPLQVIPLAATSNLFNQTLQPGTRFGELLSSATLPSGQWLLASATGDDSGGAGRGAVYALRLTSSGIAQMNKWCQGQGLPFDLHDGDHFGTASFVGDLNGDGNVDVAVGAVGDDDFNTDFGAVYLLYLNDSLQVDSARKISRTSGNFNGFVNTNDQFGADIANAGDLNFDGVPDLLVSAPLDDDGGLDVGGCWILFMNADGTVKNQKEINRLFGNFSGDINYGDRFAYRIDAVGDINNDGIPDFVAGADHDDDGGTDRGAIYEIHMQYCPAPNAAYTYQQNAGTFSFSVETTPNSTYYWNFDDGHYSTDPEPVHTYSQNGTYNVCLTVTDSCGSNNSCSVVFISTLGIATASQSGSRIWLNPDNRVLNVENWKYAGTPFSIVDITGKTQRTGKLKVGNNAVPLNTLKEGIYIFWVQGRDALAYKIAVE